MDAIAEARLRLAERCLIGAAAERPELIVDENWQTCMRSIYEMLGGKTVYNEATADAYALARNPKWTPAPTVNPDWQNREQIK